jgi:beta-galactosidase
MAAAVARAALCLLMLLAISPAMGSQQAPGTPRHILSINESWRFIRADVPGAEATGFDDSSWPEVSLPHTYNAEDGEAGGAYYRGPGWYRRTVDFTTKLEGRRLYLQFAGAAITTDVWINGRSAGRHEGGFAGFRFDVTDLWRAGRNVVAVRVDNAPTQSIAPLGGDFTVFGGLYRDVHLLMTDPVHIDPLDYGGPGVYVFADKISAARAEVHVTTRIRNASAVPRRARLRVSVRDMRGKMVKRSARWVDVPAHATLPVEQHMWLQRPHRWNGVHDPYLYTITAEVSTSGSTTADIVTVPLGIRTVSVDAERGFILNEAPYALHGVNLFHSGRPHKGLAVSDADVDEDFRILRELGATGLRLVHFQHPPRAYENADRAGLILWTEIPLNSAMNDTDAFRTNLRTQLLELIKQNQNHPSVAIWGLGNEVYESNDASHRLLAELHRIAKREDPRRLTSYAHCCTADDDAQTRQADLIGYNRYFGWYDHEMTDLAAWADELHARMPTRPIGVSEYGAGASILHQEDPPKRPAPNSHWHPEQYQTQFHEAYWRILRARPYLWGKFVWVGFDLASAGRNEGDRPGLNDKGLVTYDRNTRKDAFYWYRANWSTVPFVHITSSRATSRASARTDVKVYTNARSVKLTLNGIALQTKLSVDHVALWSNLTLQQGLNRISASSDDGTVNDKVEWTLSDP